MDSCPDELAGMSSLNCESGQYLCIKIVITKESLKKRIHGFFAEAVCRNRVPCRIGPVIFSHSQGFQIRHARSGYGGKLANLVSGDFRGRASAGLKESPEGGKKA